MILSNRQKLFYSCNSCWLRLCILATAGLATVAFGQGPLPTDTELRAAYCIRVLQSDIADSHSILNEMRTEELSPELRQQVLQALKKSKRDLESALNRVQLFILPRMPYLDSTALLAATRRADSDLRNSAGIQNKCMRECTESGTADRGSSCLQTWQTCIGGDLQSRLEACRNPTWLPF